MSVVHNIKEDTIVDDVAGIVPKIYATLDNRQAEHQSNMIEDEDKIVKKNISILIDSRIGHSYIDPNLVERFHLERSKQN